MKFSWAILLELLDLVQWRKSRKKKRRKRKTRSAQRVEEELAGLFTLCLALTFHFVHITILYHSSVFVCDTRVCGCGFLYKEPVHFIFSKLIRTDACLRKRCTHCTLCVCTWINFRDGCDIECEKSIHYDMLTGTLWHESHSHTHISAWNI